MDWKEIKIHRRKNKKTAGRWNLIVQGRLVMAGFSFQDVLRRAMRYWLSIERIK